MPRLLAVLIASLALVIAACGDSNDEPSATSTPEAAATESATPAANEFLPEGCEDVEKPAPKDVGTIKKPVFSITAYGLGKGLCAR